MTKKRLYVMVAISVVLLIATLSLFSAISHYNDNKLQGKLVFAQTYDQGFKLDRIEIIMPTEKVVLQQKDGYWLVPDKGNYYADFSLMHKFLSSFNESIFMVNVPYDEKLWAEKYLNNAEKNEKNSGMFIKTYAENKLLDELIVGLPSGDKKYFFARRPQDKNAWLISGNFNLPVMAEDWLLNPIAEIPETVIETITFGTKKIQKYNKLSDFSDERGRLGLVKPLLDVLKGVKIVNAVNEDLLKSDKNVPVEEITVTTFWGLRFVFKFFKMQEKIWTTIHLDTTVLPQTEIMSFIDNNRFLYENWFFELPENQLYVMSKYFAQ